MNDPPRERYAYSIDASHAIVAVNEAWLRFARENGAKHLTRERVLGRPLWEFIAGEDTRSLYELLFERARERGATLAVPFRCDSPDRFRFMSLEIAPGSAGGIDLGGVLLREQARPHIAWLDALGPRSARPVFPMCSLCKRIFVQGGWSEPEIAVTKLSMLESDAPPGFAQGVCERCRRSALRDAAASAPS